MKFFVLFSVLAFLIGISLFGFYKSLQMAKKNAYLERTVSELTAELEKTRNGWAKTQEHLSDSYMKTAELEGEVGTLNRKLARRDKEIKEYLDSVALLSEKFREMAKANVSLAEANAEISQRFLRLNLEHSEVQKRLSSATELKRALTELRRRERAERQYRATLLRPRQGVSEIKETGPDRGRGGNEGFFVKDGRFISQDIVVEESRGVDIQVVPLERGAL